MTIFYRIDNIEDLLISKWSEVIVQQKKPGGLNYH